MIDKTFQSKLIALATQFSSIVPHLPLTELSRLYSNCQTYYLPGVSTGFIHAVRIPSESGTSVDVVRFLSDASVWTLPLIHSEDILTQTGIALAVREFLDHGHDETSSDLLPCAAYQKYSESVCEFMRGYHDGYRISLGMEPTATLPGEVVV